MIMSLPSQYQTQLAASASESSTHQLRTAAVAGKVHTEGHEARASAHAGSNEGADSQQAAPDTNLAAQAARKAHEVGDSAAAAKPTGHNVPAQAECSFGNADTELAKHVLSSGEAALLPLARIECAKLREQRRNDRIGSNWRHKHATRPLGTLPDFERRQRKWSAQLAAARAARRAAHAPGHCGFRGAGVTVPREFGFMLEDISGRRRRRGGHRGDKGCRAAAKVGTWLHTGTISAAEPAASQVRVIFAVCIVESITQSRAILTWLCIAAISRIATAESLSTARACPAARPQPRLTERLPRANNR